MKKILKYLFILNLLAVFSLLYSDMRYYVWTYQYATMERGEGELEHYLTFKMPDLDSLKNNVISEFQLELEVGMNDHFDVGIYQVFEQIPGLPFQYKGFKIRARHRFGEKGRYFIDPLIYLEYKGVPDFHKHVIESKIILAKDIGKFNFALNPTLEYEIEEEKEFGWGYSAGMSYELSEILRFGIEFKGSEKGHYFGPVISHGKEHLWVTLGSAFKIGKIEVGKPEAEIRLLVGIHSLSPKPKKEKKLMKMIEKGLDVIEKIIGEKKK